MQIIDPLRQQKSNPWFLAKRELDIDPSASRPSHLGPKDLSFETRVITHIVSTTLLPRVGSHSTLYLCVAHAHRPYVFYDYNERKGRLLKDILLAAHFKIDVVKEVTKETGADVARIV
ncbi:hypothetical protein KY290_020975 [Solanum tuberosum]|uniref:Uncharacterized protein n=1 Tax=Solanum tuberosum TaxID=4113 RepID=A0ABQ7V069_SOLTU|nr:hypothetical protein KY289_020137 [Solanum tuberosum]KAH0692821.1 hypothetical protein KY285_019918 [Solanum tuberosum]KAH0757482.1 hypothetical protein KY290_020975 [Solanum tuberosum]